MRHNCTVGEYPCSIPANWIDTSPGEEVGGTERGALRHPFGLTLLAASLLLAGAMKFSPTLEPWSTKAPWVLVLGLLSYGAAALTIHRTGARPSPGGAQPIMVAPQPPPSPEVISVFVEEALRRLNNPAALSKCELASRIPRTLAVTRSRWGKDRSSGGLPLSQTQALREVLISAIDGLKPANEPAQSVTPGLLQFHILHEEYVSRKSTRYIMTRHNIAESTFHRNRRAAVSLVARHLQDQEAQLRRGAQAAVSLVARHLQDQEAQLRRGAQAAVARPPPETGQTP